MSTYGLELRDENGVVTFDLTKRLCSLLWTKDVSANSSGNAYIQIPGYFRAIAHAVPLTSNSGVHHYPHRITFNTSSGYLTWSPSVNFKHNDVSKYFPSYAIPQRAASRIQVIGYVY